MEVNHPHALREERRLDRRHRSPPASSVGGRGQPMTGRREVAGATSVAERTSGRLLMSEDSERATSRPRERSGDFGPPRLAVAAGEGGP
ncbi:hypothetical protein NDU88_009460 [Pleurodeles waltl]|uniref:Uncharacterized protein n=1 Tax=Pleurodeles waltl TaxID=8319 RepID=A0AAV7PV94_PLEWA|nr:hypothetical protein NDU88_009460 [Pleurodeles waltl]